MGALAWAQQLANRSMSWTAPLYAGSVPSPTLIPGMSVCHTICEHIRQIQIPLESKKHEMKCILWCDVSRENDGRYWFLRDLSQGFVREEHTYFIHDGIISYMFLKEKHSCLDCG